MAPPPTSHKILHSSCLESTLSIEAMHRIFFTRGAFAQDNRTLSDLLLLSTGEPVRTLAFVDESLLAGRPHLDSELFDYARTHSKALHLLAVKRVPGGEAAKNDPAHYEEAVTAIDRAGLCRHSCILAIGGGAVLDVVGYAASTAHRGIRLVRFPTTTLAQCDSGVGVKNGINRFGKKNFLGSFGVPLGVINDSDFLTTLPDREWRAGFSEAVKVALIKDRAFFDLVAERTASVRDRDMAACLPLLERSAGLHFQHIVRGGDPFEQTIARPLDFGHWAAHKIEQMSEFEVSHGEAVAMGVGLDTAYSALAGHLSWQEAGAVHTCLRDLGFDLYHPCMDDRESLLGGIEEFRQHLGGKLAITLLEGIGRGFTVHEIDLARVREAIATLADAQDGAPKAV